MKITDVTFTADDDLRIWNILNDYRQYRLTSDEGIQAIKKLINETANEAHG